ncbi:site-specific DNA-methyltransferase [Spirochaetia bacterium]|nr:site-specific DNA-methyltransferase [Spirochaetia bacterium]
MELLHKLLAKDGSIWISIDDNEQAYLKIMIDEIFGRNNFVANVIWEKKFSPQNDAKWLSDNHDFIIVYAKNKDVWRPNLLPRSEEMDARYKNIDNDPRGVWSSSDLTARTYNKNCDYPITVPSGKIYNPPASRAWTVSKEKFQELVTDNRIWFGPDGNNMPRIKRFLTDVKEGSVSLTIWKHTEVGHNQDAKKEVKEFNSKSVFETPKPERLIERILTLGSNPGDIVLDSFAGSGTTGAVAHKMGRRWIMIELDEHCHTHIIPRLKKVIDGEDSGGITEAAGWKGGGGFRYYRLAPSLLQKDKWDNWIINKEYNPEMLAEAVCKLGGFTYAPSDTLYWMHGTSTENDYIYVTTAQLTHDQLALLSDEVGNNRTLLVMCTAFRSRAGGFPNLTIKKIPTSVLSKCEWGHDDYSLQIENLPIAKKSVKKQPGLFEEEAES